MTLAAELTIAAPSSGGGGRRRVRGSSLITVALFVLVILLGLLALPRAFGYGTLVVRSGSMADTAPVGSWVLTRPLDAAHVRVGDVILIRREAAASPPVLHRVVTLGRRTGEVVVTTKGDSNAAPDPEPYILRGTTMTPVLAVPHVGRVIALSRTPLGWTLIIALPATVLLWVQLVAIWFPVRRRPDPPLAGDDVAAVA